MGLKNQFSLTCAALITRCEIALANNFSQP
jgi:hypothetical protein